MYYDVMNGYEFKPHGKTCAVVSSSGYLLDNLYGSKIDKYDFIIRCNNAPTKGYEQHVGSKTHMQILSHHYLTAMFNKQDFDRCYKYDNNFDAEAILKYRYIHILLVINRPITYQEYRVLDEVRLHNNLYVKWCINPDIYKATSVYEPSAGFIGVLLGLTYFDKTDIFCFNYYSDYKKQYYYVNTDTEYHKSVYEQKTCHSFEIENRFIETEVGLGNLGKFG